MVNDGNKDITFYEKMFEVYKQAREAYFKNKVVEQEKLHEGHEQQGEDTLEIASM